MTALPHIALRADLVLEVWPEKQWSEFCRAGYRAADDAEQRFREEYADSTGILGFSRVGISGDGRQALVYAERWNGVLNGSGWFTDKPTSFPKNSVGGVLVNMYSDLAETTGSDDDALIITALSFLRTLRTPKSPSKDILSSGRP